MKFILSLLGLSLSATPDAAVQPPREDVLYAFYSAEAAEKIGTVAYTNALGEEIVATMVSHSPTPEGYLWEDTQPLGEVVTFQRSNLRRLFSL